MTEQKDTKKNNNMELWNQVCDTDLKITQPVKLGSREFLSIKAQFQIKRATELWGSFGDKWGIKEEKYSIINDKMCHYHSILYYPDGEFPIDSDIELIFHTGTRAGKYNDDWSKKVSTDALTKGLSKLGFNSDIFEGKYDIHNSLRDNKYYNNDYDNNSYSNKKEEPDNTDYKEIIKKYKEKASKPVKEKIENFLGANPEPKLMKSYINGFLSKKIKL